MSEQASIPVLPWGFQVERAMYAVAIAAGIAALTITARKYRKQYKEDHVRAMMHLPYKLSLTIADIIILLVYAPTQFAWITSYWWYGGELLYKTYKFIITFAFNLTGYMQRRAWVVRLVVAWSLAMAVSLPQLAVFRVVEWIEGQPQMLSRFDYELSLMEAEQFERNPLGLRSIITVSELERKREWMDLLEKFYNAVHLSTMVFIPYVLELVLYALLLAVFARAQRGEFDSLSEIVCKSVVECRCFFVRGKKSSSVADVEMPILRAHSASIPLPTSHLSVKSPVFGDRKVSGTHSIRRMRKMAMQFVEGGVRRASEPAVVPFTGEHRPVSPWLHRVSAARSAARSRALLMLSLNLLFWLPYCMHAVASSLGLIDNFHQYQFVCALVTFNAISNILLQI